MAPPIRDRYRPQRSRVCTAPLHLVPCCAGDPVLVRPFCMAGSVALHNVALTYRGAAGGVLALKDTSLAVRRGEFAAVVGLSGCGKSSLMKLVTGLVSSDSGEIVIFGE